MTLLNTNSRHLVYIIRFWTQSHIPRRYTRSGWAESVGRPKMISSHPDSLSRPMLYGVQQVHEYLYTVPHIDFVRMPRSNRITTIIAKIHHFAINSGSAVSFEALAKGRGFPVIDGVKIGVKN